LRVGEDAAGGQGRSSHPAPGPGFQCGSSWFRLSGTGPTGLVDVGDDLTDARDRLNAACDLIVAFLEACTGLIKRSDPARPPGLSDVIAEFRRFLTS